MDLIIVNLFNMIKHLDSSIVYISNVVLSNWSRKHILEDYDSLVGSLVRDPPQHFYGLPSYLYQTCLVCYC